MIPPERAVAVALASLLAGAPAAALDRPIEGAKLVLKRTPTRATLVFVSRDPAFLFPTPGGPDDPATGSPGGLVVELVSAGEGTASLVVPPGVGTPGWLVPPGATPQFRFRNALAPGGIAPVRAAVLKEGRVLKIAARTTGLPLAGAQGSVGIRIVTGALRSCARFGGATIRHDEPGRFVARNAPAAAIADCSDASLGAPPTTTSTTTTTSPTTTSTTLSPCGLVDSGEPICGGACPPGEACRGNFSPGLGVECACLPEGATSCVASGYPACGGACGPGRVCQAFHLLPGEIPEFSGCACVDPADSCADPPGTCFAIGVCPPGLACNALGPPHNVCGCGAP